MSSQEIKNLVVIQTGREHTRSMDDSLYLIQGCKEIPFDRDDMIAEERLQRVFCQMRLGEKSPNIREPFGRWELITRWLCYGSRRKIFVFVQFAVEGVADFVNKGIIRQWGHEHAKAMECTARQREILDPNVYDVVISELQNTVGQRLDEISIVYYTNEDHALSTTACQVLCKLSVIK